MSDYISREALIGNVEKHYCASCKETGGDLGGDCVISSVLEKVRGIPAADVEPVRHGEWIEDHDYLKCPECGVMVMRDFTFFDIGDWNYCPNCGAKMCLEDETNDD